MPREGNTTKDHTLMALAQKFNFMQNMGLSDIIRDTLKAF